MKKKTQYRIRNWPEYNAALVDEAALRNWRYSGPRNAEPSTATRRRPSTAS